MASRTRIAPRHFFQWLGVTRFTGTTERLTKSTCKTVHAISAHPKIRPPDSTTGGLWGSALSELRGFPLTCDAEPVRYVPHDLSIALQAGRGKATWNSQGVGAVTAVGLALLLLDDRDEAMAQVAQDQPACSAAACGVKFGRWTPARQDPGRYVVTRSMAAKILAERKNTENEESNVSPVVKVVEALESHVTVAAATFPVHAAPQLAAAIVLCQQVKAEVVSVDEEIFKLRREHRLSENCRMELDEQLRKTSSLLAEELQRRESLQLVVQRHQEQVAGLTAKITRIESQLRHTYQNMLVQGSELTASRKKAESRDAQLRQLEKELAESEDNFARHVARLEAELAQSRDTATRHVAALEEELTRVRHVAERTCAVCWNRPVGVTLGCGHLCLCRICADELSSESEPGRLRRVNPSWIEGIVECPLCRDVSEVLLDVYDCGLHG